MNEPHNFALVRRPSGALERAVPGAKRILTGMVADTFALAKNGRPPKSNEVVTQPGKARPPRIMILDDEPSLREVYSMLFKEWYDGVELLEFGEGNKAWQQLSRTNPDLFITDRAHTGMPCQEMLERLAEGKVKFPIFLISAGVNLLGEAVLRSASENLNFSFMQKPVDLETLRTAVETALQIPARRTT